MSTATRRCTGAAVILAAVSLAGWGEPANGQAAGKFPFATSQPAPSLAGGGQWINVDAPQSLTDKATALTDARNLTNGASARIKSGESKIGA